MAEKLQPIRVICHGRWRIEADSNGAYYARSDVDAEIERLEAEIKKLKRAARPMIHNFEKKQH
jgi:hypothetical protein